MSWLTRLEQFYLNLLRVVILILATLLLVGSVALAIYAAPRLLPEQPRADARRLVQQDSLNDYLHEQRGTPATADATPSALPAEATTKIDSRIKKAAAELVAHMQANGQTVAVASVETFLSEKQSSLPDSLRGDYADSVLKLTTQLHSSNDRSVDVDALINWHYARFTAATEAAQAQQAAKEGRALAQRVLALQAGAVAMSLFLLFLLLVFGFVLVKMERNLRLISVKVISDA
jgi:hypothetical protein